MDMFWKAFVILVATGCVQGARKAISEQKVIKKIVEHYDNQDEQSDTRNHKPEHHGKYGSTYPSYEFSYKVEDPRTHDFKGQKESQHGDEVKGEYWLVEPSGAKRVVIYHANKKDGFNANVKYSSPNVHVYHKTYHHDKEDNERNEEEKEGDNQEQNEGNEGNEEENRKENEKEVSTSTEQAVQEPSKVIEPVVERQIDNQPAVRDEEPRHRDYHPPHIPEIRLHIPLYHKHRGWKYNKYHRHNRNDRRQEGEEGETEDNF